MCSDKKIHSLQKIIQSNSIISLETIHYRESFELQTIRLQDYASTKLILGEQPTATLLTEIYPLLEDLRGGLPREWI